MFLDAAKDAAAQPVLGQVAEESLDHVQPRAACGREVHVKAGMAAEPALDLGVLMGGVVVHDHVDLLFGRDDVVDDAQKLQPLLVAVPVLAHGDDIALHSIQSGEQRRGAVALVVVSHRAAASLLHRQTRLSPIQSLNLALLVSAQNHGMFGRTQIQADNVFQLLGKLGIAAELESSHPVRLQTAQDAMIPIESRIAKAAFYIFHKPSTRRVWWSTAVAFFLIMIAVVSQMSYIREAIPTLPWVLSWGIPAFAISVLIKWRRQGREPRENMSLSIFSIP